MQLTALTLQALYNSARIRALEAMLMKQRGISSFELMQDAGETAARYFGTLWPQARSVLVLAGKGNNGGDAFEVARRLMMADCQVVVAMLHDEVSGSEEARQARALYEQAGGQVQSWSVDLLDQAEVVVDGLFGIGLDRPLDEVWQGMIAAVNESRLPVLALDVPSGLEADTGVVMGGAVRATHTITFIASKPGLLTAQGPDYAGHVHVAALGLGELPEQSLEPVAHCLHTLPSLPSRAAASHKGDHGHVLLVGGDYGMAGAIRMAAEAALRAGAGLVSVVTRREHALAMSQARPEIMTPDGEDIRDVLRLLHRTSSIVLGPGLGQQVWGEKLFQTIINMDRPLVVDADGLNLLARKPQPVEQAVLTPHPGEAARLLNCAVDEVQRDRIAAVTRLQQEYGGVVVLKGAGTLVKGPKGLPVLCRTGNAGMATGGMGDVLAGVIGALLGQGLSPMDAALAAVMIHGEAGNMAAQDGMRGMLPSDLFPYIRKLVNLC